MAWTGRVDKSISEDERGLLLALTAQLAEPELSLEARLVLVAQFRLVLLGEARGLQPVGDWAENGTHTHPPPFWGAK